MAWLIVEYSILCFRTHAHAQWMVYEAQHNQCLKEGKIDFPLKKEKIKSSFSKEMPNLSPVSQAHCFNGSELYAAGFFTWGGQLQPLECLGALWNVRLKQLLTFGLQVEDKDVSTGAYFMKNGSCIPEYQKSLQNKRVVYSRFWAGTISMSGSVSLCGDFRSTFISHHSLILSIIVYNIIMSLVLVFCFWFSMLRQVRAAGF